MAYAPQGYLTLSETADRLGMESSSLRHLIRRGFLPAVKPGGVWFVATGVVAAMETLERPVGRPSELGRARRALSRTTLRELAGRAADPRPGSALIGRASERRLQGTSPPRPAGRASA